MGLFGRLFGAERDYDDWEVVDPDVEINGQHYKGIAHWFWNCPYCGHHLWNNVDTDEGPARECQDCGEMELA
jgi:NADH pyrophosphatase NudC (nudix superfamily)